MVKKNIYVGNFVSQVPFGSGASVFCQLGKCLFNKGCCRKETTDYRVRK